MRSLACLISSTALDGLQCLWVAGDDSPMLSAHAGRSMQFLAGWRASFVRCVVHAPTQLEPILGQLVSPLTLDDVMMITAQNTAMTGDQYE
jgi:hypothetical protein